MPESSKRPYVVFGVANAKSICWAIVQRLIGDGEDVILAAHPDLRDRVERLASPAGVKHILACDVGSPESVENCFRQLAALAPISGLVHGIAFSDKDELRGKFVDTSRENFQTTMLISCYSFIEIARRAQVLMSQGGSMVTLTFDAARPWPHYNVMGAAKSALETATRYLAFDLGEHGIRVNAISASPEDTLSARGIQHFRVIGDWAEGMSPLGRRATLEEIANEAAYLLHPNSSGVTGQVRYVDCGSSISNLPPTRNARKIRHAMDRILEITGDPEQDAVKVPQTRRPVDLCEDAGIPTSEGIT